MKIKLSAHFHYKYNRFNQSVMCTLVPDHRQSLLHDTYNSPITLNMGLSNYIILIIFLLRYIYNSPIKLYL